jgi:hypothetical protein
MIEQRTDARPGDLLMLYLPLLNISNTSVVCRLETCQLFLQLENTCDATTFVICLRTSPHQEIYSVVYMRSIRTLIRRWYSVANFLPYGDNSDGINKIVFSKMMYSDFFGTREGR